MKEIVINATLRHSTGKGYNRKIRTKGLIPSICYGKGEEPVLVELNPNDIHSALKTPYGKNIIINLDISDKDETLKKTVILKDMQKDPLKNCIEHADFWTIDVNQPIKAKVPFKLVGLAPGIKLGGLLQQVRRQIEIECLPSVLPIAIDVDISEMQIGQAVHIRDLVFPEGMKSLDDDKFTICVIAAPEAEVKEVKKEGEEEEVVVEEEGEATVG